MNRVFKNSTRYALLAFAIAAVVTGYAQTGVGIGTNAPNDHAALDITFTSAPKGLMIPRLTTAQRTSFATTIGAVATSNSLLVYDTDLGKFCYYVSGTWYVLNIGSQSAAPSPGTITYSQAITTSSNISVTGSGAVSTVSGNISTSSGNITTSTGTVTAANYGLNATGNGPVPKGGIIMWSGTTVPTGWILCDGTNNTPNLKGRFIVSYDVGNANYNDPGNISQGGTTQGETGGLESVTLTSTQIPRHTHTVDGGSHSHTVTGQQGGDNSDHSNTTALAYGDKGATETGFNSSYTSSATSHIHNVTYAYGNASLGTDAHENRPPYYVLAFIMKL